MKNNFITKIIGATLAFAIMIGGAVGINTAKQAKEVNADPGDEITAIANIVSGNNYYIKGVRNSGGSPLTEYLSFTDAVGATQAGTGVADIENAIKLTFTAVSGGYNITTPSGYYIAPATSNGKINVSSNPITVSATNQSSKIRLSIVSGSTTWSIQKNTSAANFGGYKNTQSDITLIEAAGAAAVVDTVTVSGDMTHKTYNTVESWNNDGLTATVSMSDESQYSGTLNWGFAPVSPAEMAKDAGEEVTNGTVRATASASGKSGYKDVSGISVNYATVAELTDATPASGDLAGVIAKGIVSQINEISIANGNATYFISDDGTTTGQYEVYRGKNVGNVAFTNANDIKVGDVVVVYGDVTTYKGTKEFKQNNYLLSLDRPVSPDPSITIVNSNFTMNIGDADVVVTANAENIPDGGSVTWESTPTSVATIVNDGGTYKVHAVAVGSATITAKIINSSSEVVASNSITVTVVEQALEDGDTFIIKSTYNTTDYYLTGVESNLGTTSTNSSDAMVFSAIEGATPGQFRFKNGNNYLSYSGSSNNLYSTDSGEDDATLWTALDNGTATLIESVKVAGRKLRFNYNNGNARFACYTSEQTAILIEKVTTPEVDEVTVMGDSSANANGAVSVEKDFLYEVSYVDPLNTGNSSVSVTVLNSSDTADGAEVTTAPSNGSFSVTFTASDTYTVTVTSLEDNTKSDSITITISNIYVPPVPVSHDYELYENDLVEGDYIFYYDGGAMNNTIDGDRAQYEEVTLTDGRIATDDNSIVWHIAPASENYFTIYNAEAGKFLASTGGKNKAQLMVDGTDDKALWSITNSNGEFDFTNKYNDAHGVNATLRRNGAYGFACYGTGTGGELSLYRLNDINAYLSSAFAVATLTDDILRLGSSIPESAWNSIAATATITDYGVMIYKTDSEANITSETPVEDAYRAGVVQPAIARTGHGNAPAAVDGNCVFTARMRVSNPETIFCAASFMVVGGQYYFFNEQHITAGQLA